MDKYLKQLLEQYAKVILPSFGAIVVENEETGNLMFNEYLSYNDGKLDDLIVSESNMELQEAQNMIAKYIRDIQVQIDKGESYDIFELGRFYKNQDGDIEFEGNLKSGLSTESKKEPTKVAVKEKSEDKKEKQTEQKKEEPTAKESKTSTKKGESNEDKKTDLKEKKVDKKEVKSETKSAQKENKYVAKKDENKDRGEKESEKAIKEVKKPKKDKAAPSVKKKKTKKDNKSKEGEKKKRFGAFFWIIIIILALASAGFIYVGLNYEKVKSYMGWDQFEGENKIASTETKDQSEDANSKDSETENSTVESSENDISDTSSTTNVEFDEEGNIAKEDKNEIETESKEEVEPQPEPEPQPVSIASASNGTHHLIAGSFSEKSNAEGLVQELKSKGLDARILGQFGGLHFVAAASYNSAKEASKDIDRIRQHASGAWIYKYNDN